MTGFFQTKRDASMSEQLTAAKSNIDKEDNLEENQDNIEIISIRTGRLLKLKQNIKILKQEALKDLVKELKEFKLTCNNTNALLGELNDGARRQKNS